jgi:predicted nucleotidyltransferase
MYREHSPELPWQRPRIVLPGPQIIFCCAWLALLSFARCWASPPTIELKTSAVLGANTGAFSGQVRPQGQPMTSWVEWGVGTNLDLRTAATNLGEASYPLPVYWSISNLSIGQTYSYRFMATNADGAAESRITTFTVSFVPEVPRVGFGLPPLYSNAVACADLNGDGLADVALSGPTTSAASSLISRIYRGLSSGEFDTNSVSLTNVNDAILAWGDYDNNGSVDLFLSGSPGNGAFTALYRNDGAGGLTPASAVWPALGRGSAAWGDYDNDGDLDLLLAGEFNDTLHLTRIYENVRGTFFWNSNVVMPGLAQVTAAWGDFDRDGDLDVLLTSFLNGSQIFENRGDKTFRELPVGPLKESRGAAVWVDYDGDGDLDVVAGTVDAITGDPTTRIYRNENGHFDWDASVKLLDVTPAQIHWADYDNDGAVDLYIAGEARRGVDVLGPASRFYRNDGRGHFTEAEWGLGARAGGAVAAADFFRDGSLDLLVSGLGEGLAPITRIYRNASSALNTLPGQPGNLAASVSGRGVTLSWSHGRDRETTNANWLSSNIRVGVTPGGTEIVSPQAIPTSGQRLVYGPGNVPQRTSAVLTNLVGHTTYYWSVQTIDSAFNGSRFPTEVTFSVGSIPPVVETQPATDFTGERATINGSVIPEKMLTRSWFEYGPTSEYGSSTTPTNVGAGGDAVPMSFVLTNVTGSVTYHYRLVATNPAGRMEGKDLTFTLPRFGPTEVSFQPLNGSGAAWGDYDNDGDLDLVVGGYRAEAGQNGTSTRLYRNDANGRFTALDVGLPGVGDPVFAWGDYDNDGALDLFLAGSYVAARIFRNDGGQFRDIEAGLPAFALATATWGDIDHDGDLDLLLSGAGFVRIYRNDGQDRFSESQVVESQFRHQLPAAWTDYDADGDLDLAMGGADNTFAGSVNIVFHLNDGGTLSPLTNGLSGTVVSSLSWGDYDNDGAPDLLAGGTAGFPSQLYRNNKARGLEQVVTRLPAAPNGSATWADYDNDGDLDILIVGAPNPSTAPAGLFENQAGAEFVDSNLLLPLNFGGTAIWGDYDNDGDLDLFLCREPFPSLQRNNSAVLNTPPSAPDGLTAVVRGVGVTLSWSAAVDAQTAASGLNYNLRVGTTPGGVDVVSPQADVSTGFRRVPQPGNIASGRTAYLTNLASYTTYYWSVQAIDTAYAGSAFSAEGSFTTPGSPPLAHTLPVLGRLTPHPQLNAEIHPLGLATTAWLELGTNTDYGHQSAPTNLGSGRIFVPLRLALSELVSEVTYHYRVVATNSEGRTEGLDQSFTVPLFTDIGGSFPSISGGSATWADFDNDGSLDFLLTGQNESGAAAAALYRNDGQGSFAEVAAQLPGGQQSAAAWGDFDRDGWLDLVIAGSNSGLYRNAGGGAFTNTGVSLPNFNNSSLALGDGDNDGDTDFVLIGRNASLPQTARLYRNDRGGIWITDALSVPVLLSRFPTQWGDYDADGDLDFVGVRRVFENKRNNEFLETASGAPGFVPGALGWADFDNDGDLDCLANGADGYQLFRNDGNGQFVGLQLALPRPYDLAFAWGDFDNDGDMDLVLSVSESINGTTIPATRFYRNDGHETFVPIEANLPSVGAASFACGDYDNDGDLDLLVTGNEDSRRIARVYRNNSPRSNSPPSAVSGLSSTVTGQGVQLRWAPASDFETTDARGLSYNLRIGTTPGGVDVISPAADVTTGWRRVPQVGSLRPTIGAWLTNLPPGRKYYWSVQAIDPGLAGSPFAEEQSFEIAPIPPVVTTLAASSVSALQTTLNGTLNPGGAQVVAWFEWGLTTNYGNRTPPVTWSSGDQPVSLSAVVTGLVASLTYHFRLVATNEAGLTFAAEQVFTPPLFIPVVNGLPGVVDATVGWADFNNDGALDFVLSGGMAIQRILWIYQGDGTGAFRPLAYGSGVSDGSVAPGDFDNDGDLDLLVTGFPTGSAIEGRSHLLRNNGQGGFLEMDLGFAGVVRSSGVWADFNRDGILDVCVAGALGTSERVTRLYGRERTRGFRELASSLPGVDDGTVLCADFDNDGLLDLLMIGSTNGNDSGVLTRLYRNEGAYVFRAANAAFPGLWRSAAAAADYDNDGDLDFVVSGRDQLGRWRTSLYRNEGSHSFIEVQAGLPGVEQGSLAWGDLDNDGRVDLVLTGSTNGLNTGVISRIYRNVGAGVFSQIPVDLPGIWRGAAALGDYDNDHDLDLVLAGRNVTNALLTLVLRNDGESRNLPPEPPAGLSARSSQLGITFSWDPAFDAQTPSPGLSFNLRIGTTPGGAEICSAQASSESGYRRLFELGNVQQSRSVTLTNLPRETLLYWSVQSVDGAWAGSPFAPEQIVYVGSPRIQSAVRAGDQLRLVLAGPVQSPCVIELSTNLVDWADHDSVTFGPAGMTQFSERAEDSELASPRFYRLRTP